MSPEVGESGTFGGDDGLGGYMPLAVAVPTATAGITELNWVHSDQRTGAGYTKARDKAEIGHCLLCPKAITVAESMHLRRDRQQAHFLALFVEAEPLG